MSVIPACLLLLEKSTGAFGEALHAFFAAGGIKPTGFYLSFDRHIHFCIPYNPVLEMAGIPQSFLCLSQ